MLYVFWLHIKTVESLSNRRVLDEAVPCESQDDRLAQTFPAGEDIRCWVGHEHPRAM
jgi:hypothetical protein